MFTLERQQGILEFLKQNKSATVKDLSKKFFIGEATIRRDLKKLESRGFVKRTYGGALLLEGLDTEIPLFVREIEQKEAKTVIGRLAANLVKDGDIIILDSSSTILKMIPYLKNHENLTVITNGAKAAIELGEQLHMRVYCTGGMLRENSLSYIGEHARNFIKKIHADVVFFSCRAIDSEKGLTDSNEEEAELRTIMLNNSAKRILLCDDTKFDRVSFCRICDFDSIDMVVTNKKPSDKWLNLASSKGTGFIYPV